MFLQHTAHASLEIFWECAI